MDQRRLDLCAREFEAYIIGLFETARKIPGTGMAEIPLVGGVFLTWGDYSPLLLRVSRAVLAREKFPQDAPGYPSLPLHEKEIEAMENDDCPRCALTGLYAGS